MVRSRRRAGRCQLRRRPGLARVRCISQAGGAWSARGAWQAGASARSCLSAASVQLVKQDQLIIRRRSIGPGRAVTRDHLDAPPALLTSSYRTQYRLPLTKWPGAGLGHPHRAPVPAAQSARSSGSVRRHEREPTAAVAELGRQRALPGSRVAPARVDCRVAAHRRDSGPSPWPRRRTLVQPDRRHHRLPDLNGGLPPRVEVRADSVTVSSGLRYADIAPVLQAAGRALANLGSLAHISVSGAVATGTHGSGDRLGCLASAVSAVELVTASGESADGCQRGRAAEWAGGRTRCLRDRHRADSGHGAGIRGPPVRLRRPNLRCRHPAL